MNCRKLEPAGVEQEVARLVKRPLYRPDGKERSFVSFRFSPDVTGSGKTLFAVFSNLLRAVVYRGPFHTALSVEMDERLMMDKGYDSLEFSLIDLELRQHCGWGNDRGEPYWRPGNVISITFLEEATVDQDGLYKMHEVTIRL
jgi:hypothetical protein